MFPFAYVLERKERPKLKFALFLEFLVLSLLGIGLTLNMYFASLRYTSPMFLASTINTIASLTFVIAVVLRLEVVYLQSPRGLAKVLGAVVSLASVLTMTLYKGPIVKILWRPLIHIHEKSSKHENWLKGSILTVASCVTWSIWYIMQVANYKILLMREGEWLGAVCSGLIIFVQLWGAEKNGPVFVAMFDSVPTILVAIVAYFVLGERLSTGSIVAAVSVILGQYLLLWGKEGDGVYIKPEERKDNEIQNIKEGCAAW